MGTISTYLEPLGSELSSLTAKAHDASELGLSHVDSIIARLERARSQLINFHSSSIAPTDDDATMASESSSSLSVEDDLLPLSMLLKSSAGAASAAHKEWSSAVSKFAKSVDKKFPAPPQALFPPAAQKQVAPPPAATSSSAAAAAASSSNNVFTDGLPRTSDRNSTSAGPSQTSLSMFSPSTPSASTTTAAGSLLPFSSPEATRALNSTIALHLARLGAFESLSSLNEQTHHTVQDAVPDHLLASLKELHRVLAHLKEGVCTSALEWIDQKRRSSEQSSLEDWAGHAKSDPDPDSDLEFELRKEEYIQLLLSNSSDDEDVAERQPLPSPSPSSASHDKCQQASIHLALRYGGHHFRRLMTPARRSHIEALLTAPIYMPFERLLSSPYALIFAPYAPTKSTLPSDGSTPTCAMFTAAFLSTLDLPKDSPLIVVTDIGGSGAMAKIHKVRAVMKEQKTSWSAIGELPVEVPLPINRRYHSIFACPVSKEQSTPSNPPMLLTCGHVIARESLVRLARGTPTLKCPYCPVISHASAAVRVHF